MVAFEYSKNQPTQERLYLILEKLPSGIGKRCFTTVKSSYQYFAAAQVIIASQVLEFNAHQQYMKLDGQQSITSAAVMLLLLDCKCFHHGSLLSFLPERVFVGVIPHCTPAACLYAV
jgi:hypothetical protein